MESCSGGPEGTLCAWFGQTMAAMRGVAPVRRLDLPWYFCHVCVSSIEAEAFDGENEHLRQLLDPHVLPTSTLFEYFLRTDPHPPPPPPNNC